MQGLHKGKFTKRACFSANDYNLGIACLFYTDRCDRYLKWEQDGFIPSLSLPRYVGPAPLNTYNIYSNFSDFLSTPSRSLLLTLVHLGSDYTKLLDNSPLFTSTTVDLQLHKWLACQNTYYKYLVGRGCVSRTHIDGAKIRSYYH